MRGIRLGLVHLVVVVALAAAGGTVQAEATPADSTPVLGRTLTKLDLKDFRGKEWSLNDFAQAKVLVIGFSGVECPLAKLYAERLEEFHQAYRDKSVAVVMIDANPQDSLVELAAFAKKFNLTHPILRDSQQTALAALGARRTPEFFVLDSSRRVRYHGRFDDQHAIGGRSRTQPQRRDLTLAVDELLAGKAVSVPETNAFGCLITRRQSAQANAPVTFSNQIVRLFHQHCVDCHRPGEIGHFSLLEYSEAAGWAEMIEEVTRERRMPPWHADPQTGHFSNARRLSESELQLIRDWVAAGAPEGDPQELPPAPVFNSGWQMGREPDLVIPMSETPYEVPATGVIKYQYFSVDLNFTEDKWIAGVEVIAGNREIVHHVIALAMKPGSHADAESGMLGAYAPGNRYVPFPKGMAKRIEAGSRMVFQLHYTPNGKQQSDISKVGLIFADPKEITHEIRTESVRVRKLRLEPRLNDQRFETVTWTAPADVLLLGLMPHMHLRGKAFRFDLAMPGGKRSTLLDVPQFDFNWQTGYALEAPLELKEGSQIVGYASYDNSAENLANPDPDKVVTWGDQTWDEMGLGYFDIAIPVGQVEHVFAKEAVERLFASLDKNKNALIEKGEVPPLYQVLFNQLDTDEDGTLSKEEVYRGVPLLKKALAGGK